MRIHKIAKNAGHKKKGIDRKHLWKAFDGLVKVLSLPITTSILYYVYERRQIFVRFLEEHSDEKYKKSLRNLMVFFHRNNCSTEECIRKYNEWNWVKFRDVYDSLDPPNDREFQEYLIVNDSITHIWEISSRMHQIRTASFLGRFITKTENLVGSTHLTVMTKVVCPIELQRPRDLEGDEFTKEMCSLFQQRYAKMESYLGAYEDFYKSYERFV